MEIKAFIIFAIVMLILFLVASKSHHACSNQAKQS